MKVIAWYDDKTKTFKSVEDAAAFFRISPKRVLWCIKTGHKWRGVIYDEGY